MPPVKSIAVTPPRRGQSPKAEMPADDDGELISVGPVLVRPARRTLSAPHHRYHVGERLRLSGGGHVIARAGASCKVLALLPYEGKGALLYRIRSDAEQYDRIVSEADLSRG
jgi:hypothetical protein